MPCLLTVLISCDIKSVTWYYHDIMLSWPNWVRKYLIVPFGRFGDITVSTKLAWCIAEAYQKGTIMYKYRYADLSALFIYFTFFFVIRFMFFENIQTTHPSLVLGYNAAINIPDIFQCVQVILYYSNNCNLFKYLI